MDKKKRIGLKILIIVVIVGAIIGALVNFITDFMWFSEMGYVSVFLTKLFTMLKIGIPVFIVVTFLAYIYLKVIKMGYFKRIVSSEVTDEKKLNLISWGLAGAFGLITTYISTTRLWFEVLQFFNSTDFNKEDPLFNNDISFYVLKLGFINGLSGILLGVLVVFLLLTAIYYGILISMHTPDFMKGGNKEPEQEYQEEQTYSGTSGTYGSAGGFGDLFENLRKQFNGGQTQQRSYRPASRGPSINKKNIWKLVEVARGPIIAIGVALFLMIGVTFFLKQFDLLQVHRGAVYGAGFTDVNITLWMYRVLVALSVVGAVLVAVGFMKKRFKMIALVPAAMILVGIIGMGAGAIVQNFVVSPDEINKESKYLEYNMACTRDAYDLGAVDVKSFSAAKGLTSADITKNAETINNIRINDYTPAEKFYNQTQSIRQYYEFNNVDVDRYVIDGELTQTFLSAREIDESRISDTWMNRHLKYTHGYGITLSRVDEITSSGQPKMIVDSIPPESDTKSIKIKRPEIYFGELTNDYILVNTDEKEFDYPDGDNNKYTKYQGKAGVKMNLFARIMFSIREKSLKLLVSSNVNSDSRIVINRNIEERVNTIMPYLEYEEDPYMVTVDGKLYWIIDAYTTSEKYPYSEPWNSLTGKTNYIRNSIKVVIDAYNGNTDYYIVDPDDPIAQTYKKIFPALFKDGKEMPEGLRAHIRYPHKMFNTQAKVYERYHMKDVNVFYQREDVWAVSDEMYGTEETEMSSQYYVMSLPGETQTQFVNSIPYTPKDKKNMTGIFMAKNDGDNYGELVLYQLPKSKVVYGPMQIEAQIDQNTEISKEFSLWASNGSNYSRGNMFVIPIEDSLLYVEPIYLEATNSSIPEVKRVIVAYGDQIAYKPTLAEALVELFGDGSADQINNGGGKSGSSGDSSGDSSQSSSDSKKLTRSQIIKKAQEAFDKGEQALKDGNWTEYGKQQDKLKSYLEQLGE